MFYIDVRVRFQSLGRVINEADFTRENLYCLVAIAFFIWRIQYDIRHVTTSPLTVSESNDIDLVVCLMSTGGYVDIRRIGGIVVVCSSSFFVLLCIDL